VNDELSDIRQRFQPEARPTRPADGRVLRGRAPLVREHYGEHRCAAAKATKCDVVPMSVGEDWKATFVDSGEVCDCGHVRTPDAQ